MPPKRAKILPLLRLQGLFLPIYIILQLREPKIIRSKTQTQLKRLLQNIEIHRLGNDIYQS